jgi:hypothetical protein
MKESNFISYVGTGEFFPEDEDELKKKKIGG